MGRGGGPGNRKPQHLQAHACLGGFSQPLLRVFARPGKCISVGVSKGVYVWGEVCVRGRYPRGGWISGSLSIWVGVHTCVVLLRGGGLCLCGVAVGEYWCVCLHLWGVDM